MISVLLPTTSFDPTAGGVPVFGDPVRGDGFSGSRDGLHTVQWTLIDFVGTIAIQGTLSVDINESEWATIPLHTDEGEYYVDTSGKVSKNTLVNINYTSDTTNAVTYNFQGNYTWVRAKITDWTGGTIFSILLSH